MARLALAAILLVALAPTASRWQESGSRSLSAAWSAMCTSGGLKLLDLAHSGGSDSGSGSTPTHPMQGDACGYCALLAHVTPLLFSNLVLLLRFDALRVPDVAGAQPRQLLRTPGLGARGPPLPA